MCLRVTETDRLSTQARARSGTFSVTHAMAFASSLPQLSTQRVFRHFRSTTLLTAPRLRAAAAMTTTPQMNSQDQDKLIEAFRATVPPLTGDNYKGQHGKLGVVGGCTMYTGAPFFAAQSAHKTGADLTYVICTPGASPVIKSFSPDMIVMPLLLDDQKAPDPAHVVERLGSVQTWLSRMTVLVVGPGLGEDPGPQASAAQIIRWARDLGLPLVIDGSAITTVAADPSLIQGYKRCVMTPNMAELGRLARAVGVFVDGNIGEHWQAQAQEIAAAWDGPILVSKGKRDIITDGSTSLMCDVPGSLKRCGGIGDVVAGTMGTFLGWQYRRGAQEEPNTRHVMVACLAACSLVRHASREAFSVHGRAMGAGDVLSQLYAAFTCTYGP